MQMKVSFMSNWGALICSRELIHSPFGNCIPGTELLQFHSGWSFAWDHFCGVIDDPCDIIADFCVVNAYPCDVVAIPEAIGGRAVGDADSCGTHSTS